MFILKQPHHDGVLFLYGKHVYREVLSDKLKKYPA